MEDFDLSLENKNELNNTEESPEARRGAPLHLDSPCYLNYPDPELEVKNSTVCADNFAKDWRTLSEMLNSKCLSPIENSTTYTSVAQTEVSLIGLNLTTTNSTEGQTEDNNQNSKLDLNYEFEKFCPQPAPVKVKITGQAGMPILTEVDESKFIHSMTSQNELQGTQSCEIGQSKDPLGCHTLSKMKAKSTQSLEGTPLGPPATIAAFKDVQRTDDKLSNIYRNINSHHSCLSKAPEHWKTSPVVPYHALQAKKLLSPGPSPDRPTPTYKLCFTSIQSGSDTDRKKSTQHSENSPSCPEANPTARKVQCIEKACQTDHAQFLVNKAVQVSPVMLQFQCTDLKDDEKALETKRWIDKIMHF